MRMRSTTRKCPLQLLLVLYVAVGFLSTAESVSIKAGRRRERSSRLFVENQDYDSDMDCLVEPLSSPSYVTAFYRQLVPSLSAAGCDAVENSTSGREIHVVRLVAPLGQVTSSRMENSGQPVGAKRRMRLRISMDNASREGSTSLRELVIILVSSNPLTWDVQAQRLSKRTRVNFWVLHDSNVERNPALNMKVRRIHLPSIEPGPLTDWVRHRLGPITRMNDVRPSSRSVTISIPKRRGVRCKTPASTSVKQATQGCVARWNEGVNGKDVHIIDLHSTSASSSTTATTRNSAPIPVIEIAIRPRHQHGSPPLASSGGVRRHMILVLKLRRGTGVWKIRTNGLRGTLDIVTDQAVDMNGIDVNEARVVSERLASLSGTELVSWIIEKYGPPVSYNEVLTPANYFELNFDGGESLPGRKQTQPAAVPVDAYDDDDDDTEETRGPQRQTFGRGWTAGDDEVAEKIRSSRILTCRPGSISISLSKRSLGNGLSKDWMSLMDQSCRPRENATHFYWTTRLSECGMISHHHENKLVYENAVMIRAPRHALDSNDDQDFSSGSGLEHVDEEYSESTRSEWRTMVATFSCEYENGRQMTTTVTAQTTEEYQLRLFDDVEYRREIQSFPVSVDVKRRLYVEATRGEGANTVQAVIDSCSLVFNEGPTTSVSTPGPPQHHKHDLISNGCLRESTMRWIDDLGKKFEFTMEPFWEHQLSVALHCQLASCTTANSRSSTLPPCVDRSKLCAEHFVDGNATSSRHYGVGIARSLGPILVIGPPPGPSAAASISSQSSLSQASNLTSSRSSSVGSSSVIKPVVPFAVSGSPSSSSGSKCGSAVVRDDGVEPIAVVCIAFAAFIIGVLMTGAIWYIHVHTGGPRKRRRGAQRSLDASGASTPCSNAPITVHQIHRHA